LLATYHGCAALHVSPNCCLEAYFVGRKQILDWLNSTFAVNYSRIEECGTGAIHCQILDRMFPGKVPMSKVNFGAKHEYEFIENFKIVQTVLDKVNVNKTVPIPALVRAKYQDNLEFMQWLYHFYITAVGSDPDENYDPVAARSRCKGALLVDNAPGKKASRPALTSSARPQSAHPSSARSVPHTAQVPTRTRSMTGATVLGRAPFCPSGVGNNHENVLAKTTTFAPRPATAGSTASKETPATAPQATPSVRRHANEANMGGACLLSPTSAFLHAWNSARTPPHVVKPAVASSSIAKPAQPSVWSEDLTAAVESGHIYRGYQAGLGSPIKSVNSAAQGVVPGSASASMRNVALAIAEDPSNSEHEPDSLLGSMPSVGKTSQSMPNESGQVQVGADNVELRQVDLSDAPCPISVRFAETVTQIQELYAMVQNVEREKNFYLAKIVELERLCLLPENASNELCNAIKAILYASEKV